MTICARVQPSAGLNVVADVPLVTPFSTAHATAPAQKESAATSVKPLTVLGAVPIVRYRKVTLWPRVQVLLTPKVPSAKPLVMPFSSVQATVS